MIMPGEANQGDAKQVNDSSMAGMDMLKKTNVSMDFTMQLNAVFEQYIVLKDAFVQSDVNKAKKAAQEVLQALSKVDIKLLSGDACTKWINISGNLKKQMNSVVSSGKIEEQRIAFSGFSDQFYKAIKTFSLMGKTAYYQFCPMAKNGKGAYWLSETSDIRNPYYGESMLTCGETKETLKY
jgi:Cu(I)/Ag(I) efflux system membrane fusion protein